MTSNGPSDLDLLQRFACIGSEKGSYAVLSNTNFAKDKTESIHSVALSKEKSLEAIRRLKKIFKHKCFLTKDPLLFALARIIRDSVPSKDHEDDEVRHNAYKLVQDICETGTDLFTFVYYNKQIKETSKVGWGRGLRNVVSHFYESKAPSKLANEVTKCKSARGFTHRDLIRQCHLRPDKVNKGTSAVMQYILRGKAELDKFQNDEDPELQKVLALLKAVESLNSTMVEEKEVVRCLIEQHALLGKQIPSKCFQIKETFEGMMGHLPLVEVVRSIPKMASLGMLDPSAPEAPKVIDRLSDLDAIRSDRISPVLIFMSMKKYESNKAKQWIRNPSLLQAFNRAYEASLQVVPKTGKRHLLATHLNHKVSKLRVVGSSVVSPIMPCAVLTQMMLRAEDDCDVVFFHASTSQLKVSRDMSTVAIVEQLLEAARDSTNMTYDLSEPLNWAILNRKLYDNILILSDKKTVTQAQNFRQAVLQYRSSCVAEAKVAVVGLSDTTLLPSSNDLHMLDIAGFNETVPELIHKFFFGVEEACDDS